MNESKNCEDQGPGIVDGKPMKTPQGGFVVGCMCKKKVTYFPRNHTHMPNGSFTDSHDTSLQNSS